MPTSTAIQTWELEIFRHRCWVPHFAIGFPDREDARKRSESANRWVKILPIVGKTTPVYDFLKRLRRGDMTRKLRRLRFGLSPEDRSRAAKPRFR